jgi:hypothetical protein
MKTIDGKVGTVDNKVEKMFERANLVNGNVSNIRTDIADLQEDLLELYSADDLEYQKEDNGRDVEVDKGHGRDSISTRKNRKRTDLARRIKRRQIETDRIDQEEHPNRRR